MMVKPLLPDDQRAEVVELASQIGPAAAAAQYGLNPATVGSWLSRAGKAGEPSPAVQRAHVARRTATALAAGARIEDFLEEVRTGSALYVNLVAMTHAKYAMMVATMSADQIVEKHDKLTGARWVEFTDPEAEELRLKVRALGEGTFSAHNAVGAMTRATHDLRLLREQSTENVATSVSFVADLAPEPKVIEGEIIEADEVD